MQFQFFTHFDHLWLDINPVLDIYLLFQSQYISILSFHTIDPGYGIIPKNGYVRMFRVSLAPSHTLGIL